MRLNVNTGKGADINRKLTPLDRRCASVRLQRQLPLLV